MQAEALVEWASLEVLAVPPSTDLPPASGDLTANQGYRLPNPGLDSDFVSTVFAGDPGLFVRLSDCEYGWNPTHEDLNEIDLHLEPGQTISSGVFTNGWDEHGTAVAGVSVGLVNEYGVSGMAPGVEFHTYPEWTDEEGFRRVTCITNAIANSNAGDVVLLEMQTVGLGGGYGPAELDLGVWTAVKVGTDAGVVVVGAAGNGNQNLDSATYASYLARGDSGAILVGAGSANTNHDKLSFSTYGARVDVQAWGTAVTTTGYGTVQYNGSDEDQWYTNGFNGTSSASSLTAPSCAVIQAVQLQYFGTPLTSPEMRDLLIATGWAQGTGGHIGPAVNIRAALESLLSGTAAPAFEAAGDVAIRAEPNPFRDRTRIRFDAAPSRDVAVDVFDVAGRRVRALPTAAGRPDRETTWDGRDEAGLLLAPGVYFLRVRDGEDSRTGRVVLSR
ncbi:MAG: S8 family peptidase [Gemmatimonadetes bacterium]|nr:S8 family peptidase [Gemmatimonadota bacterium]